MKPTLFYQAFSKLTETAKNSYTLVGDTLLVEEMPKEEVKTKSGIVLSSGTSKVSQMDGLEANRPIFCRVLAVGEGYFNDKNETIPLDTKVGDIILVGKLSVRWLSYFGPIVSTAESQLGMVSESEIRFKFNGIEGYRHAYSVLESVNAETQGNTL
jgi:co-chaperonin GroES (HSP10)